MWCVADLDAEYLRKMEDVLAVYEKPFGAAEPVVCLDEKPVSLHADLRPPLPARPGQVAKRDNEYKRCGTANVFCAVEPKAGKHFTFPTPDRSAPELARVLDRIIGSYPFARTIHLVMDNLNIHCRKTLTDYFGEEEGGYLWNRLSVHYTPKHGSWLNQAEIRNQSLRPAVSRNAESPVWTCFNGRHAPGTGRSIATSGRRDEADTHLRKAAESSDPQVRRPALELLKR
jgi:hypothetical protein